MTSVLASLASAKTPHEIVAATSRYLETDVAARPIPIETLGPLSVQSLADIERCIEQIKDSISSSALLEYADDRAHQVLSYLLVASIRARQLA